MFSNIICIETTFDLLSTIVFIAPIDALNPEDCAELYSEEGAFCPHAVFIDPTSNIASRNRAANDATSYFLPSPRRRSSPVAFLQQRLISPSHSIGIKRYLPHAARMAIADKDLHHPPSLVCQPSPLSIQVYLMEAPGTNPNDRVQRWPQRSGAISICLLRSLPRILPCFMRTMGGERSETDTGPPLSGTWQVRSPIDRHRYGQARRHLQERLRPALVPITEPHQSHIERIVDALVDQISFFS